MKITLKWKVVLALNVIIVDIYKCMRRAGTSSRGSGTNDSRSALASASETIELIETVLNIKVDIYDFS